MVRAQCYELIMKRAKALVLLLDCTFIQTS